ncbi:Ig-like domain-containing protein [Prescottella subtropica]|uniref:Ig-like domain-containing protein n=1 Tax=Prescottella subtropica TaxID=2545757 RepID=UPI0010F8F35B|nr:Ig-like domain-containing protein [Prescottella subtropica]
MTDRPVMRYLAPVCATGIAAGIVLSAAPASAATVTTPFNAQCRADALLTVHKPAQHAFTVDTPDRVDPGQTFTYRIQPAPSSYPDKDSGATTTNVSRMKVDYQLPDNATFVDATVVPGTGIGLTGTAANVLQVNENGDVDDAGTILRLSGDNEVIGNSPKADKKSTGGIFAAKTKNYLDGTPSADGSTWFQLPAIDVTVTAGAGGEITPKLRTAGTAANLGDDGNYNTFLALAKFGGDQWAPTRCVAKDAKEDSAPLNRGGGPLATIAVGEQTGDVSATAVTAPETADAGTPVTFSATVTPAPADGNVAFLVDNIQVGEVPVVDGTATFTYTFDRGGDHTVAARYVGNGIHRPSLSTDATVTVEGGTSGSATGSTELPSLGSLTGSLGN